MLDIFGRSPLVGVALVVTSIRFFAKDHPFRFLGCILTLLLILTILSLAGFGLYSLLTPATLPTGTL